MQRGDILKLDRGGGGVGGMGGGGEKLTIMPSVLSCCKTLTNVIVCIVFQVYRT